MESKIDRVRAACSIEWAWKILGLPGKPGRNCNSPFRQDKKPSFSVYMAKDGERWYDQGEGVGGDVVDFWAQAKGISVKEALDRLGAMMGEATPPKTGSYKVSEEKTVEWPGDLRFPTTLECVSLGMLRDLPSPVFDLASSLGFLKVGTHRGELLWFLTDASKNGGEGKTFTGDPCIASSKKVVALPNTNKNWCYGLVSNSPEWNRIDQLILCEGTPDFFAALALLIDWPGNARPITMLGSTQNIGEECREYLKGKKVLIIPHNDQEGEKAAKKWVGQLLGFNATVFSRNLPSGKDLNEFLINPGNETPLDLLKGLATHGRP